MSETTSVKSTTICLTKELMDKINKHSIKEYPYECCGILIGDFAKRELKEILETENIRKDRLNDRFEISGEELVKGEMRAASLGLDVIGYYHSHPDHPNRPSEYDRARAFAGLSYIIVSVKEGKETKAKSWVLSEKTRQFQEESIKITN